MVGQLSIQTAAAAAVAGGGRQSIQQFKQTFAIGLYVDSITNAAITTN